MGTHKDPEFESLFAAMRVNELVRFAREDADLKPFDLAERLKCSQTMLSRLENAKHVPTIRTLARIAMELGLVLTIALEGRGKKSVSFDGTAHRRRSADLRKAAWHERNAKRIRDYWDRDPVP